MLFFSPQAFASERVFGVLSETLYNLLQLVGGPRSRLSTFSKVLSQQFGYFISHHYVFQDWEQRQEEDNLLIERILVLVRNVLHVPTDPGEEKVCFKVIYVDVKRQRLFYQGKHVIYFFFFALFIIFLFRKWMMMPASTIDCCGQFT